MGRNSSSAVPSTPTRTGSASPATSRTSTRRPRAIGWSSIDRSSDVHRASSSGSSAWPAGARSRSPRRSWPAPSRRDERTPDAAAPASDDRRRDHPGDGPRDHRGRAVGDRRHRPGRVRWGPVAWASAGSRQRPARRHRSRPCPRAHRQPPVQGPVRRRAGTRAPWATAADTVLATDQRLLDIRATCVSSLRRTPSRPASSSATSAMPTRCSWRPAPRPRRRPTPASRGPSPPISRPCTTPASTSCRSPWMRRSRTTPHSETVPPSSSRPPRHCRTYMTRLAERKRVAAAGRGRRPRRRARAASPRPADRAPPGRTAGPARTTARIDNVGRPADGRRRRSPPRPRQVADEHRAIGQAHRQQLVARERWRCSRACRRR